MHDAPCVAELQTANHLKQVGLVVIEGGVGQEEENSWHANERGGGGGNRRGTGGVR